MVKTACRHHRAAMSRSRSQAQRRTRPIAQDKRNGVRSQLNLLDAKRNIAQEAKKLVEQEMQNKSGEEFDMAYIGSEIVGLTSAMACLEVSQRYVGSELGETLKNAQEEARTARDKAEEIAKTLAKSHGASDRANPSRPATERPSANPSQP
jgi:hypothetical protein